MRNPNLGSITDEISDEEEEVQDAECEKKIINPLPQKMAVVSFHLNCTRSECPTIA
jgi:hypothetical protein